MIDRYDTLTQQIAFSSARGINAATAIELLDRIGGLDAFFTLSQAQLRNLSGINSEIFSPEYRQQLLAEARREADYVRSNNVDVLFVMAENYPQRLRNCEDAPVVIYRCGSCDLDAAHMVAVVGTRRCTQYGTGFTANFVKELAQLVPGLVIVSGLAYGIDICAHRAAIEAGVPTVAVLGDGLSELYPAQHKSTARIMARNGGAIVTEYRSDTPTRRSFFLARNRIIAGLCDCTLVVESDYRGGSLSTARAALHYGRDVFAVPGRVNDPFSSGTNRLIANQTASLVTCAQDMVTAMGWETLAAEPQPAPLFRPLSPDEQEIVDFIKENPDATINDLCVRRNKSYSVVSNIIFGLEMEDMVTTLPGGRFALSTNFK